MKMAKGKQTETEKQRLSEREERINKLQKDIEASVFLSETLRESNSLALILLVKGMDLICANYDNESASEVLQYIVEDRANQRRVPTTQEYAEKLARTKRWLPTE